MAQIQFKPIEKWPHEPTKNRQRSRFDSTYTATLKLLNSELDHLNAKDVHIHLWLGFGQIKNDGTPYADARPTQPGVIVRFTGKHGAVEMACDEFDQWRDNLRAIAKSLEALRMVDRYGCSKKGQQYTGWKALPPAPGVISDPQSAANFIARHCQYPPHAILTNFDAAYREAAARCHPDTGGSHELFVQLQAAAGIMKRLGKERGLFE
jgi:hypothetical protein